MSQATLIKESDIRLVRGLVGRSILYYTPSWCSNSVWALKRVRVANPNVFECLGCLEYATRATQMQKFEEDALLRSFPKDPEAWVRQPIHEEVMEVDFTQFVSPAGEVALLNRGYVEAFGVTELFSRGPDTPFWDASVEEEATLALAPAVAGAQGTLPLFFGASAEAIARIDRLHSESEDDDEGA